MKGKLKVNFFIIGAPKCATTWIEDCLKAHPQIFISSSWPFHFFKKGDSNKNIQKYKSDFKKAEKDQIKGMDFPNFLYFGEEMAKKIKKHNPDAKLIVSLRNPIERAHSHYLFGLSMGGDYGKIEEALSENSDYVRKGLYCKQLKDYLKHFPKKNILILIYEDIKKDPVGFVQKIYTFLGVNSNFVPEDVYKKKNYTVGNKMLFPSVGRFFAFLRESIRRNKKIYGFLKRKGGGRIAELILSLNARKKYFSSSKPLKKPFLNKKIRNKLASFYKEDIDNLEKLISRELDFWK